MAPRIQVIIPAEAEHYEEHEFMSPEDILECLKLNLGNNVCPSVLLELAEEFDVTPRLLESEEAAFLVPYYNLVTEIKRLIGIDDKDQFASFLIANRELVQKYSPVKVFQLICQHSAAACATALLESGLDVDVNLQFKYTGKSPLFMAARNLSYGMTKVLLDHGADADLSFSGFGTPLWNAVDAFSKLKYFEQGCTDEKSIPKLFYFFCLPELKEPIDTIRLLASHSHQVKDLCIALINSSSAQKYAVLLLVAWDKLMVSSAEGDLETTPVGQHIFRGLRNVSYLHEICGVTCEFWDKFQLEMNMKRAVKNLTIAWYVVKTMSMTRGVIERYFHSRVESVPMYELPIHIIYELKDAGLDLKPGGVNILCLLPKATSKAKTKVLPEQKYYVEPRRSGPVLFSFVGKPVTGTSGSPSLLHFQYRTLHILNPMENHLRKTTQVVKPSSHNVIALTKVCAPLMWFAKRSIK